MILRVAGIVKESLVDGPGIRYVIFTQGCLHNCRGCHNPETHDIKGGYEISSQDIINDIDKAAFLNGVTFSGGEPFLQSGILKDLAMVIKRRNLNIMAYSGYTFEELNKSNNSDMRDLLNNIDILVDGKFDLSQRDLSLKFRGSRNQRIINVKESLKLNIPVLMDI